MINNINGLWPVLLKVILPAVVTAAGTTLSLLDSDIFLAFCGVK